MNPDQLRLARHALGFPNENMTSYRNHYSCGIGSPQEAAWNDLTDKGLAIRGKNGLTFVGFCLTERGARMALDPVERLDPEDFPQVPNGEHEVP